MKGDDDESKDPMSKVGIALLIGGAIGVLGTLFLTSKSGKDARDALGRAYERSRSKWTETEGEIADRIARLAEELRSKADELLVNGKTLVEERRKDLEEGIAIAKRALDEERALLRRIRERANTAEGGAREPDQTQSRSS